MSNRLTSMLIFAVKLFACFVWCYGQNETFGHSHGLSEAIGNFSLELLYHENRFSEEKNIVLSPIATWTSLTALTEGAVGSTRQQLIRGLRTSKNLTRTRVKFAKLAPSLITDASTAQFYKFNGICVDTSKYILRDFRDSFKTHFNTFILPWNFSDSENLALHINRAVSNRTKGRITKLVQESDFSVKEMILTSASYFKGKWAVPFDAFFTSKRPFYDSNGVATGEVKMMSSRHAYPLVTMQDLQAKVLELPFGTKNKLSMILMLPIPGVTVEAMFLNLQNVSLTRIMSALAVSKYDVDCLIPRFKIRSNLELSYVLKRAMGIENLFKDKANLANFARFPVYVKKVIHRAEIEVTETVTSVAKPGLENQSGITKFEANRPFFFIIVEKTFNTILMGGFYKQPSLY